jgi:hypothetical protein
MKTKKQATKIQKPRIIHPYKDIPPINKIPDPPEPEPDVPEIPKAPITPATKTIKVKAPKPEGTSNAPKITKKSICIEMVSRKGGATLDEIAQAISDRGICSDIKVNKTTAGLWMHKIGFAIAYDKERKTYSKSA